MNKKANRALSILLALVMVFGMLPAMSQTAQAAGTNKAIQFVDHSGTTSVAANIEGGQKSFVYFGKYKQSPDGSGDFNWDPIKWRVLSNTDGKLFLLSDQNLDVMPYHNDDESVTWEKSTMRSWLNGYAASENWGGASGTDYSSDNFIKDAFVAAELAAIASTNVVNADNPDYNTPGGNNTTDKVFLLSIAEARNSGYGFTDSNSRISTNTAYVAHGGKIKSENIMSGVGEADRWWLRSPGYNDNDAARVNFDGFVNTDGSGVSSSNVAVRPALNLNLSSVLFTSAAADGKAGTTGELSEITEYTGSDWKLTLKDESRKFAVTETAVSGKAGETVTLNYTGATLYEPPTDPYGNEYISAILTDENGNLLRYGRLTQPSAKNGTVDVKIPADLTDGEYTLKVFSEQYNGDAFTDYASEFDEVALTVGKAYPTAAAVTANNRKYDGTKKPLVTVDESILVGGTMQYALGKDAKTAPEEGWSETIPSAAEKGTYYVWYMVKGDDNHNDSAPQSVTVTISEKGPEPVDESTITFDLNGGTLNGKTGKVTVTAANGTVITLPAPTRDGYTFDYWEGSKYYAGDKYKVNGDHTFKAVWKTADKGGSSDSDNKGGSSKKGVKTGDEQNVAGWITMMIASVLALAALAVKRKDILHR